MELEERINLEARLTQVELFMKYMVEEVLPNINLNNVATQEFVNDYHVTTTATAMLLQNVAILTLGKEEYEELLKDESFADEVVEAAHQAAANLKAKVEAAKAEFMLRQMLGGLMGHEPSKELCADCDKKDCDHRIE